MKVNVEKQKLLIKSNIVKFLLMEVMWKLDLWRVSLDGVEYVDQDKENCDQ